MLAAVLPCGQGLVQSQREPVARLSWVLAEAGHAVRLPVLCWLLQAAADQVLHGSQAEHPAWCLAWVTQLAAQQAALSLLQYSLLWVLQRVSAWLNRPLAP